MSGDYDAYKKKFKILDDGIYEVVLELPFETKVGVYPVLRFPFKVNGVSEPVVPNYFDLFDCTNPYDYSSVSQFRESALKIKACFKLPGAFSPENYAKWVGCKGIVRIRKTESGFTNITYFYKKEDIESNFRRLKNGKDFIKCPYTAPM